MMVRVNIYSFTNYLFTYSLGMNDLSTNKIVLDLT